MNIYNHVNNPNNVILEETADEEFENFLLSDKFDFAEALEEKKNDENDDESGFDADHEFPDLPEDLRNVINLEDLQKVIKMELDEPELDYEPQGIMKQSNENADYHIDHYDHPAYYEPDSPNGDSSLKNDMEPATFSEDPVVTAELGKKSTATSWVVWVFLIFAISFLVMTFKRWRRLLLRWLLKCGENGNGSPGNNSYNTNMYSNRYYGHGTNRSSSRETLI